MTPIHPDLLVAADLPVEFGRYTLLKILGEGAMARVFEAELHSEGGFRKRAAVKVIHATVADKNLKLRESLYREAQMGGLLHHPNVVETYDFGETDGHPWIAMEVIDGVRLDQLLLQYGRLPPHIVLETGIQICDGLAHAHSLVLDGRPVSVIHRDLKPPNVMISREGQVKVMDFGIAKATHMTGDSTEAGHTKGTPAYMSPEQCTAAVLDGRSDVFAVGALLFEMAAGFPFFQGESVYEVMAGVLQVEDRLRLPGILEPADAWVPGLGDVVRRCLRSDRELRYASAIELDRALRAIQAQHPATFPLRTWLRQVLDDPTDEMAWTDMASSIYDRPPPVREAPTAWQSASGDGQLPAIGDLSGPMDQGEPSGAPGELSGPMGAAEELPLVAEATTPYAAPPLVTEATTPYAAPPFVAEPSAPYAAPPFVAEPSAPHVAPAIVAEPSAPQAAPTFVPEPSAPQPATVPPRPASPPSASAPYLRPKPPPVPPRSAARDRPASPLLVFGIALFGFSVLALALVTFFVWDFDGRGSAAPVPTPTVQVKPTPSKGASVGRAAPTATPRGRSKADVPAIVEPLPSPAANVTPARGIPTPSAARTPAPTPRIAPTSTPTPDPEATAAPTAPRVRLAHQPPSAALLGSPNPLSFRLEPADADCNPVLFHASWPPGPDGYDSQRLSPAGGGAWEAELFIPYLPEYRNGFRYRVSCVGADGGVVAAWPAGGSTHAVPALAR
jgi:eukaryotic-like serine/threonine-protein kinase